MINLPLVIDDTKGVLFHTHGVLQHHICVFRGNSGSGKSLLFRRLRSIFKDMRYTSALVKLADVLDSSVDLSTILDVNVDVLLIDNGDLTPIDDIISSLSACTASLILITSRDFADISRTDIGYYVVKYTGSELSFELGWD